MRHREQGSEEGEGVQGMGSDGVKLYIARLDTSPEQCSLEHSVGHGRYASIHYTEVTVSKVNGT